MALWREYQANEVAADDSYKGRTLRVHGTVHAIAKDFTDSIVLSLRSPNQFMTTHATIEDSGARTASALSKGMRVTLICQGGGMIIGSPILRDCTFE